ncbi:uncharacterized protein LOC111719125 [Sarcophilus harrisii]|uniref:uncharacterized protein LOC111719125 n=1 Tax=Sarcophilus harrisii TaxID=9305 RepID=UPI001301B90E|nr:uncharacterized protein LOC111719125 [Sarcophilus harrisii]
MPSRYNAGHWKYSEFTPPAARGPQAFQSEELPEFIQFSPIQSYLFLSCSIGLPEAQVLESGDTARIHYILLPVEISLSAMRPRQCNVPRWASKSRRAGKKFPVTGKIQLHPQYSEPAWEVSVELGASLFKDPLSNSRENEQDIGDQEFKVNVEADSPLPLAEVCCPSGSRYQTREEEEDVCYSEEEGDLHPSLVTENIIHLEDSQEVHSSSHKRQLPLDSPNTSSSTKRPCPEGRLSAASSSHQESSELAMLRHKVNTLHTRLDIMTSAMNALYKYTQTLHQILEIQAKED